MTTRAQLESEREALIEVRAHAYTSAGIAAVTASIARVEALLSLSDEQCAEIAGSLGYRNNAHVPSAAAYRTVADLVRRS